jgi:hypothetical protein
MLVLCVFTAVLLVIGVLHWHKPTHDLSTAVLSDPEDFVALCDAACRLGYEAASAGLSPYDPTPFLCDGHDIVRLGHTTVQQTWPGRDPTWLGDMAVVQSFVAGYISRTNPQLAQQYAHTFCAMVGAPSSSGTTPNGVFTSAHV